MRWKAGRCWSLSRKDGLRSSVGAREGGVQAVAFCCFAFPAKPVETEIGDVPRCNSPFKSWSVPFCPLFFLFVYRSPRRRPGSRSLNFLDSGFRRNDEFSIDQRFQNVPDTVVRKARNRPRFLEFDVLLPVLILIKAAGQLALKSGCSLLMDAYAGNCNSL